MSTQSATGPSYGKGAAGRGKVAFRGFVRHYVDSPRTPLGLAIRTANAVDPLL